MVWLFIIHYWLISCVEVALVIAPGRCTGSYDSGFNIGENSAEWVVVEWQYWFQCIDPKCGQINANGNKWVYAA